MIPPRPAIDRHPRQVDVLCLQLDEMPGSILARLDFLQLLFGCPDQFPDGTALGGGLGRVAAMLEGVLIALGCPGGRTAVHPAPPILHCR